MTDTLILGHRGWSARYPENTLLAFSQALDLGCDGLEFDVQLTADEVPVILHDPTVDRTTGGSGRLADLTFAELRRLNAAARFAGAHSGEAQPIPNLQEVLDLAYVRYPGGLYNVELKVYDGDGRELVDRVLPLVLAHPLASRVVFSSFHHGCLAYLKSRYPGVEIGLLYEGPVQEPWRRAKDLGAYSVNLDHRFAADVVAACQAHGVRVCVWTVDPPDCIRAFLRQGVDILISNQPDVALQVRKEG
jgi:glycerophosphoryl diester phosphodiesterase